MSLARRLRLDSVIASFPELGPTIPDGGYSWAILLGVTMIQISVSSVLPIYGIVLGYLARNSAGSFDLWTEKIMLTPILFVAFWSLSEPWSRAVVELASVPRLVGLIGVCLLSIGVTASGYLATGGVGAYLASLSAGAIMGIGASLLIEQAEAVLRKYFRTRLPLAMTARNVAASFATVLAPSLARLLLEQTRARTGLLLVTCVFLPAAVGALILRLPAQPRSAAPYSLLVLADEDDELPIGERCSREPVEPRDAGLFGEGNDIYAYQDFEEDDDASASAASSSARTKGWLDELRATRSFRFWLAVVARVAATAHELFFWILVPALFVARDAPRNPDGWAVLPVAAGLATCLPHAATYWMFVGAERCRRSVRGAACWLGAAVCIGLTYSSGYLGFLISAAVGGIGIGCLSACRDSATGDASGDRVVDRSRAVFSTIVGSSVLLFSSVHGANLCLRLIAALQLIGGFYWILSPTNRRSKGEVF